MSDPTDRCDEIALNRASELLALRDNWDSYGSRAIPHAAVDGALRLRAAVATEPIMVPTNGGGVQLEWHNRGFDVELELDAHGKLVSDD